MEIGSQSRGIQHVVQRYQSFGALFKRQVKRHRNQAGTPVFADCMTTLLWIPLQLVYAVFVLKDVWELDIRLASSQFLQMANMLAGFKQAATTQNTA